MTPPPRRGVPAQTQPEDLELTSRRVGWFNAIIAAALVTAGIGWGAREWSASYATKSEVATSTAASSTSIESVRTTTEILSAKVAVVESDLKALRSDVTLILTHVLAISKATDAHVPASTPQP